MLNIKKKSNKIDIFFKKYINTSILFNIYFLHFMISVCLNPNHYFCVAPSLTRPYPTGQHIHIKPISNGIGDNKTTKQAHQFRTFQ